VWIGTIGEGLWTYRDGRLTRMSGPGILPSDTVLSIFEDDQGQIWIGTQAGLVRLNRTMVSLVPLPEEGDPDFETISGDDAGDLWVAAHHLYLIRDHTAHRLVYPGIGTVPVRNVYRAHDGSLWIGTDGGGAYNIRGAEIRHYTAPAELTNNFIRGFLESHDGHMWIATDGGVSRIGRDGVAGFTVENGLAYMSTRSLLEDRSGNIWIGTDRGSAAGPPESSCKMMQLVSSRRRKSGRSCRTVTAQCGSEHEIMAFSGIAMEPFNNTPWPKACIQQPVPDTSGQARHLLVDKPKPDRLG